MNVFITDGNWGIHKYTDTLAYTYKDIYTEFIVSKSPFIEIGARGGKHTRF